MNLRKEIVCPSVLPTSSSAEPSHFCRQDAGSTLKFMENFNLQDWTRSGTINRGG